MREFLKESNAIEDVHSQEALEDSLEAWAYLQEQDELTHEVVKQVHHLVLQNRQPEIAGQYRQKQVQVGDHIPPDPQVVHLKMEELLQTRPSSEDEAVDWHVRFETIHPFPDGNGRVGRLLYAWHCRGLLGVEPRMWTANEREEYYELFRSQRATDKKTDEGDNQST